jgi:hypothetical protein
MTVIYVVGWLAAWKVRSRGNGKYSGGRCGWLAAARVMDLDQSGKNAKQGEV